ncbi:MAG: AAA family ATPase [Victivallales bacterium]|nr:AAA family ATPase [Victivallales bacterium]
MAAMMKDLTSYVYCFEDLIQGNLLYVDKTEYVWKLISPLNAGYFLSRPRRFGKSLLISTLKAIFQGKKELFKGLALYDKPYDWKTHPVIHLSFGDYSMISDAAQELPDYLMSKLETLADEHSIALTKKTPGLCFAELIDKLSEKGKVVILIDEYDKPILGNITDANIKKIRDILKGFYSVLKDRNDKERLLFITGVSKFSHVSLFSELNNLTDITMEPDYAEMLGFTEAEVRKYFADRIPDAAKANEVTEDELMKNLMEWYDGYRFSKEDTHVCNPVSITKFFANHYGFSNYWDSTGTPSFLIKLMEKRAYDHEAALKDWYDESIFAAYELDSLDITGMLWQTGYLTIKNIRKGTRGIKYQLDFPDKEVRDTFCLRLLEFYGNLSRGTGDSLLEKLQDAIMSDDVDAFLKLFQSVLANIDYKLHINQEQYYHSLFFIVFFLLGSEIEAESCTNEGRIDAYIRTSKAIYIFEFKLNKTAKKAVSQIIDKHYYEKFQGCGLPIRMIGVNFNHSRGRIDGWQEMAMP